jgi:hypothetical protein
MGKGGELRVFFLMEESFGSFMACGVGEIGVRERWKGAWQQRVLSPDWSDIVPYFLAWPTKSELRCAYYGRNKARIFNGAIDSANLKKCTIDNTVNL